MQAIEQNYTSQEQDVLDIFQRHVAAFTSGNLDAVLDDFTDRSVVITPDGVFEGRAQIRALYQALLAEFGVIDNGDSPGIAVDALQLRHDTLLISWHGESKRRHFPFGTDTFIGRDNKFARQSIAFGPTVAKA